jgi:hypothetical protein
VKSLFTILFLVACFYVAYGQQSQDDYEHPGNANQLEDLAEDDELVPENDYDIQQLRYFARHPIDINSSDLEHLTWIDPLLVSNLSAYRKLLGDIIDIHELQAVPGFTIEIIKSIQPYITLNKHKVTASNLRERFIKGEHTILFRPSIVPETSAGFDDTSQGFIGSRPAFLLRYKYQYGNLLQFGFVTDKDAGERLLVNGIPDFLSFHLFVRRIGLFKSIAIGDFTVNMGQGLIYWQSQAFRKSPAVINVKRQSDVLRPYHSAGEHNFNRGLAATVSKGKLEGSFFLSVKKITANVDNGIITSVNTSGLHRTREELIDKGSAAAKTAGINLKRIARSGQIGINSVYRLYSLPLLKKDEPYNLYAIKGRNWFNISSDYAYTFRNLHLFGEVGIDKSRTWACINGVMASISATLDAVLLHRRISKSYQSVFGNAFTESTTPSNENGCYAGIVIKPGNKWKVDLYADLFSFPWLKYRLDVPMEGFGYLFQVTYKPNKQTEIYTRFKYKMKPLNVDNEDGEEMAAAQFVQNWRTHLSLRIDRNILLRSRVEICLFNHQMLAAVQSGYLFYADLVYNPISSNISGNVRFQAFESENYDTRIYVYENDVLFSSSIPSYYNNGVRIYVNIKAKFRIKYLKDSELTLNLRAGTTVYKNLSNIGSDLSSISGNRISALKLQVFLAW